MMSVKRLNVSEISQHSHPEDAWIVINVTLWDVTEFAPIHPGATEMIHEYLGQDASVGYN